MLEDGVWDTVEPRVHVIQAQLVGVLCAAIVLEASGRSHLKRWASIYYIFDGDTNRRWLCKVCYLNRGISYNCITSILYSCL